MRGSCYGAVGAETHPSAVTPVAHTKAPTTLVVVSKPAGCAVQASSVLTAQETLSAEHEGVVWQQTVLAPHALSLVWHEPDTIVPPSDAQVCSAGPGGTLKHAVGGELGGGVPYVVPI
jgi:hypothetical protein